MEYGNVGGNDKENEVNTGTSARYTYFRAVSLLRSHLHVCHLEPRNFSPATHRAREKVIST
jgi:hypothetical protein